MRVAESQDRPQTLKQAKKAFKARGPTSVSAEERRRLERGAQLLERASKIKEQEQRKKKAQLRKKESKAPSTHTNQKDVLLGTQRKLDKFGYKSSQFHLGAFLKPALPTTIAKQTKPIASEPWEDEDLDDDTLLDVMDQSPEQARGLEMHNRIVAGEGATSPLRLPKGPSSSPIGCDVEHWDDFIESSTQLARELALEKPLLQTPPPLHFSSFSSTDFDLSVEEIEELDPSIQVPSLSHRADYESDTEAEDDHLTPMPNSHVSEDRKLMPPPPPPRLSLQRRHATPMADEQSACFSPVFPTRTTALASDISIADLELLAGEDIELTQYSGD